METALRNLSSSVQLVAVAAQSDAVEQWDEHTLSRAFQWARYCEQLYSRFHDNPVVRGLMEQQLLITNQSISPALPGYTAVSFLDLSRFQHLLLTGLLNNPKLPLSIIKLLFCNNITADPTDCEFVGVTGLCSLIIQCKYACTVLSPVCASSVVPVDAEVQALLLMERLGALLRQSGKGYMTEHFLDSVFQGCEAAAVGHFCVVIAAALLTTNSEITSQDFVLDWLLKKHRVLQSMCSSLPTAILMAVVKKHPKVRDSYCDVLKQCASDMEYSISDGEWLHSSTNPTMSFQKLTEHFLALFETCPSLRDYVEKDFNALKISDGDFDVRGLSVWGDLLSAFHE